MKRRREKMPKASTSGSKTIKGELISSPSAHDSTQMRQGDGAVLTGRKGKGSRNKGDGREKEQSSLSRLADLSINEGTVEKNPEVMDFNDSFPDEILLHIFKYVWRPENCWDAAKVCKRWHVLQASNLLQKRSDHVTGNYPCMGLKKGDRSGKKSRCNGKTKALKLKRVETEWRLSMDLLQSCKRHIHNLEIKDCTHMTVRGYQLIAGFASNLKSLRLEACNTMDNASFDLILDRCSTLRSVHLTGVSLTLGNIVEKAPRLQELHVHGCRNVTVKTLLSILHGLTSLRSLSLTYMGEGLQDWDGTRFEFGPPLKLQHLHLENSHAITDRLLLLLSSRLLSLKKLDLTLCKSITDDGLKAILASSGNTLTKLVMTRCRRISDESMSTLAKVSVSMQDLFLAGCAISNEGLRILMEAKCVPKLRNLSLACCSKLTDAGLEHFVNKEMQLTRFKTLDLQNCPGISAFVLKLLPEKLNGKKYKVISEKKSVMISE